MKFFLIFFLLCGFAVYSSNQNPPKKYRWPLNINNGFSSSFQEFRGNHFHAGVDLRTYQKTGYPIFAIADGHIFKIRMVRRGSGRGLYLKHRDGNSSAYFHLQRFAPGIEKILTRVQTLRKKKYFGNYFLQKPYRVKQGDVIGYTGETGSGFPHLHLEIRDGDNNALNPFSLIRFPNKDIHYPKLRHILVRNNSDTLVNERVGEQFIRLNKKGISLYVPEKPLVLTGGCDIILSCYDTADTGKRVSPNIISAFLDDDHFFHLQFERFSWAENNQLGMVYDMLYSKVNSYHFNLFNQKGFHLESRQQNLQDLLINLSEGPHQIRVMVGDNFQNLATAIIPVYKVKKPVLLVKGIKREQNDLHVNISRLEAGTADEIALYIRDINHRKVYSGDLSQKHIPHDQNLILKGVDREAAFLEFEFIKKGIGFYKKQFNLKTLNMLNLETIDYSIYINRDKVFLRLNPSQLEEKNLQLEVLQGGQHQLLMPQSNGNGLFFVFTPLNNSPQITLNFKLYYQDQWVKTISDQKTIIYLQDGTKQTFSLGNFSASFAPHSVYEPKSLLVSRKEYGSDYPVLSQQISLSPFHFPFLDTVYYQFKLHSPVEKPKQLGLFKYHETRKRWYYAYTLINTSTLTFKTRVLSSGTFALMRDVFPPEIYFRRSRNTRLSAGKNLVLKITDKGKGIDDISLKVWINGMRIDCEYDPDWRHVVIGRSPHLRVGKNLLRVAIKDHGDNLTTRTFTFNLK